MNIHEHQAKEIFRKFNISVPNGVAVFSLEEIDQKFKLLNTNKIVLKAQIHAGGRGKAGGIKIINNINELKTQANNLFGKKLVTHQTGPQGRTIKRLYLEETCDIKKEFYLSSKKNPEKIITVKQRLTESVSEKDINKIIQPFALPEKSKKQALHLVQSIYKILVEKDASLIEINPLILTKDDDLLCLDAKINFDDNALYRHPDILSLKDPNEENPIETEASRHKLAYIKLNGKIGCMVNGAGLAMATMDIIKLYGSEPANFLDVGGGASKEKVSAGFKIILSDKNVKGILINIFGGIMKCDVLAQGVVKAAQETNLSLPLVVRLAGTNVELGREILKKSNLKIISANNLSDAAKKIIEATK